MGKSAAYCAKVVFQRLTFYGMIRAYIWRRIKEILPEDFKYKIKKLLGIKGSIG